MTVSFLQPGDTVEINGTSTIAKVQLVGPSSAVLVSDDFDRRTVHAENLTLLCSGCEVDPAESFTWEGAPFCALCAPDGTVPVRRALGKLAYCPCGNDLDGAIVEGVWTIGDTIAEYRTCRHCKNTRPFIGADVVRGRKVGLYLDDETSQVSGEDDSFLLALGQLAAADLPAGALLIRNGAILAEVIAGPVDHAWRLMMPEREEPLTEDIKPIKTAHNR